MLTRLLTLTLASTLVAVASGCDGKAKTGADANKPPAGDAPDKGSAAKPIDKPPPGVKIKGNVITKTTAELAAEGTARDACVAKCVEARKVEARGADDIAASCKAECDKEHPVVQVEVEAVVPSLP